MCYVLPIEKLATKDPCDEGLHLAKMLFPNGIPITAEALEKIVSHDSGGFVNWGIYALLMLHVAVEYRENWFNLREQHFDGDMPFVEYKQRMRDLRSDVFLNIDNWQPGLLEHRPV